MTSVTRTLRVLLAALVCVPGIAHAATVAAGLTHTVVVTPDGHVWTWGANDHGQLGDGTTTPRLVPGQVPGLSGIIAVSSTDSHTLALASDGTVWAWGGNWLGQVGDGATNTDHTSPVQLSLTNIIAVSAGHEHSLALQSDGTVWTWGDNFFGQLARTTSGRYSPTPTAVSAFGTATAISAGAEHSLILKSDGTVWGAGGNFYGEMGGGGSTPTPTQLPNIATATKISGGGVFSEILLANGTVRGCGYGGQGQLGDGTQNNSSSGVIASSLSNAAGVSAGWYFTAAVASDGTAWAWGENGNGQLGDGTQTRRLVPTQMASLSNVAEIAAGSNPGHGIAVTTDGVVWTWGSNASGQLGNGTTQQSLVPIALSGPSYAWKIATPAFSVAAGTYTTDQTVTITCLTPSVDIHYTLDGNDPTQSDPTIASGGTVTIDQSLTLKARAWKTGFTTSNIASAAYIMTVNTVTLTPAGGTYTSPVTVSMSTTTPSATIHYTTDGTTPTAVSPIYSAALSVPTTTIVKAIGMRTGWTSSAVASETYQMNFGTAPAPTISPAPGSYTSLVTVTLSGIAGAMIRYTTDGSTPTTSSPLYVGPFAATASQTITARTFHPDYTASTTSTAAYTIIVADPVMTPTSGTYSAGQTIAVTSATTDAELHFTLNGADPTESDQLVPTSGQLIAGTYTLKVRAWKAGCTTSGIVTATYAVRGTWVTPVLGGGFEHSAALLPDGTLWVWGGNTYFQIGDGTHDTQLLPGIVSGLTGVQRIGVGDAHNLVVLSDGTVWAWGENGNGRLGDGSNTSRSRPVLIPGLTNPVVLDGNSNDSIALLSDGTVMTWGDNCCGQLGHGSPSPATRNTPGLVPGLTNVTAVGLGVLHALAVRSDGTVWAWGLNDGGQIGNGNSNTQWSPSQVTGLTNITSAQGGYHFSVALDQSGTVWTWGANAEGELGDGTNTPHTTPAAVLGLSNVTQIAAGAYHVIALRADGTVWTWGGNGEGEIGDGTQTPRSSPTQVSSLSNIVYVAAGDYHSLALAADGTVWAWGRNQNGTLGDGTTTMRLSPVPISGPNFTWGVATPNFSLGTGTYAGVQQIVVSELTPGATIHYTVNGVDPTESDPVVASGGTVTVDHALTLKARAWKTGLPPSKINTAIYTLKVPAPGLSVPDGVYNTPQSVIVSEVLAGVELHYTLNGAEPTQSDPTLSAGDTVPVMQSLWLRVKGWKSGWLPSDVGGAIYTLAVGTIGMSPDAGAYTTTQSVTMTTVTPAAEIHYTINGVEPTVTDPFVTSGATITVDATMTLKAQGFRTGWSPSGTKRAIFTLSLGTVATPIVTPAGGSFSTPQGVSITTATTGAIIRITTDGTEPTLTSPAYTGPLTIAASQTIQAKAFKADMIASATTAAVFDFDAATVARPVITPGTRQLAAGQFVTITTSTAGATLHYTTTGLDPTELDPVVPLEGRVLVDHSLRLKAAAWKTGSTPSPVVTADYSLIGAIAAGFGHTVALKTDGTVWTWGKNDAGQLGDGSTTPHGVPAQVPGLTEVIAIAAGYDYTLAIRRDGTVWAWGANGFGALGVGDIGPHYGPVQVSGLSDVVAIAAGSVHSLAVKRDGTVWAWGNNDAGQLGDGTTQPHLSPVQVTALSGVTTVAVGTTHSAALRTDGASTGTIWLWGANDKLQLGDGTQTPRYTPTPGLSGVVSIAASWQAGFVVLNDGTVRGWGQNTGGVVGDGSFSNRSTPVPLVAFVHGTSLSSGSIHTLGLQSDGTVWSWGSNDRSQLSQTWPGPILTVPAPVVGLPAASTVAIAAGDRHSVALLGDGTLWTWGSNEFGQLGNNSTTDSVRPVQVADFSVGDETWLTSDPDGDGLSTARELALGTDPMNPDTNGDGILDGAAIAAGISATNLDMDGDGVPNAVERARGTDPFRADTDGDGVADGVDAFPLDPTRWQAPVPDPNDHTPPTITLIEPTSAVPIPPP